MFSPLKERSDHKCFGLDFECYGHRGCFIEVEGQPGVCINPCDAQYSDEYKNLDVYNANGVSSPKCIFDTKDGNTYCHVTDYSTGKNEYIQPSKNYRGTQVKNVFISGDKTAHISDEGSTGNGLHVDQIKNSGNLRVNLS